MAAAQENGSGECLIGNMKAYVTGSPSSKKAVILVSDVYGFEAPVLRNLADKVAANGFFAVVPDYFHGDRYAPEKCSVPEFLDSHGTEKGFEDTKALISYLKSNGISSIGVGGICRGGKVAAELSKTDEIQAAVMFHPSLVTLDDIRDVKVPTAILGAETDRSSPPELLKKFEEVLSAKREMKMFLDGGERGTTAVPELVTANLRNFMNSRVKIFSGVGHGWTMRKTNDEAAMKMAEEAHNDMIQWFTTYVH